MKQGGRKGYRMKQWAGIDDRWSMGSEGRPEGVGWRSQGRPGGAGGNRKDDRVEEGSRIDD